MQAMHILRSLALLTFCVSSASAREIDSHTIRAEEVIEEVVATSPYRCGSWLIEHLRIKGCEYAELKKDALPTVLDLRPKLFHTCLSCQGNRCVANEWSRDQVEEELLCKRIFWTPTRVSKTNVIARRSSPLRVWFTFTISTDGRVEDIELVSFEGDIEEEALLRLIENGAIRTRFEPLVVADKTYEIVGLTDAFILDGYWSY